MRMGTYISENNVKPPRLSSRSCHRHVEEDRVEDRNEKRQIKSNNTKSIDKIMNQINYNEIKEQETGLFIIDQHSRSAGRPSYA